MPELDVDQARAATTGRAALVGGPGHDTPFEFTGEPPPEIHTWERHPSRYTPDTGLVPGHRQEHVYELLSACGQPLQTPDGAYVYIHKGSRGEGPPVPDRDGGRPLRELRTTGLLWRLQLDLLDQIREYGDRRGQAPVEDECGSPARAEELLREAAALRAGIESTLAVLVNRGHAFHDALADLANQVHLAGTRLDADGVTHPAISSLVAQIDRADHLLSLSPGQVPECAFVDEVTDLRTLFAIQWDRMADAAARWRAEDPQARALVMPDLGVLLRWLMDDADRARAETPPGRLLRDSVIGRDAVIAALREIGRPAALAALAKPEYADQMWADVLTAFLVALTDQRVVLFAVPVSAAP